MIGLFPCVVSGCALPRALSCCSTTAARHFTGELSCLFLHRVALGRCTTRAVACGELDIQRQQRHRGSGLHLARLRCGLIAGKSARVGRGQPLA